MKILSGLADSSVNFDRFHHYQSDLFLGWAKFSGTDYCRQPQPIPFRAWCTSWECPTTFPSSSYISAWIGQLLPPVEENLGRYLVSDLRQDCELILTGNARLLILTGSASLFTVKCRESKRLLLLILTESARSAAY